MLKAVLDAPMHLKLRGWQGAEDSPEELEDQDTSLCLLANMNGCFLPVQVMRATTDDASDSTERLVQVLVLIILHGLGEPFGSLNFWRLQYEGNQLA